MLLSSIRRPLLITWFVLLAVAGCGRSPDDFYLRAQESAKARDASTAVLDLKKALQERPDFAAARRLLGEQYLELGDAGGAIKELQRAIELGQPEKELLPLILRAELDSGNAAKVIERLAMLTTDDMTARLWSLRGDALLDTQDVEGARAAFGTALRMDPNESSAHLGAARLAWARNDIATAQSEFAVALRLDPESVRTWLSKGDFEAGRRQFGAAVNAFNAAFKKGQGYDRIRAELGLARVHLLNRDLPNAQKYVDLVLKQAPELPMVHYLAAMVAHQKGELPKAQEQLEIVLAKAPGHIPSLFLKGLVGAAQQKWVQAEQDLTRVIALVPNDLQSRKLLANVYIQQGNTDKALAVLEQAAALGAGDPQFQAMLGSAYLRKNQPEKGLLALQRAAQLAPNEPEYRNQIALGHLAMGDGARATSELRDASRARDNDMRSDVLLLMVLLRDKKYDEALAEAQRLIRENPKDPVRYNLAAAAWLGKENLQQATLVLQQALKLDPKFGPAKLNLALIALRRNDATSAYRLYQEVWNQDKTNYRALAGLLQIDFQRNRGTQAIAFLERVRAEQPKAIEPRSMLLTYYGQMRDFNKAVAVAKESVALQPGSPELRLAYAQALLAVQRPGEAVPVLEALARDTPKSADAHYELARAKLAVGNRIDARQAIERSLELADRKQPAAVALAIVIAIEDARLDEAKSLIAALRTVVGDVPNVQMLEGDVASAEQRWADAIVSYRKSMAVKPTTDVLSKLTRALSRTGQSAAAKAQIQAWLQRYPRDTVARVLFAGVLMESGQTAAAQSNYEMVLKATPNNAIALNNLALLYLQKSDRRASVLAEKALSLLPDNAEILDSVAWIRFKNGQRDGVVEMLRKATDRSPNPEIRYHIAEVLASQGDRAGARRELDRILAPGTVPFPSRASAVSLRARM